MAKGLAIAAIVVSLLALLLSGWLVYRGQQQLAEAESRLSTVEQGMQSSVQDVVRPRLSQFDSRLQSLGSRLDRIGNRVSSNNETLNSIQESLQTTQTQVAELSDQITGGNNRLDLSRIESMLRAANERLQLYNDPQSATRALELASEAISRKNDPRLFDIRSEIANEIAALEALPDPDVEGLALQLAAMVERVPQLPLAADAPNSYQDSQNSSRNGDGSGPQSGGSGDSASGDDSLSLEQLQAQFSQGWDHFRRSLGDALSGMVTIRRDDGTQTQRALLPPEQAFFLQQNLQLALRTARMSLLERDTANYRESLENARQWLGDYYDTSAAPVQSMRQRLSQMSNVQLDWQTPDISESLVMLRERVARQSGNGGSGSGSGGSASGSTTANSSTSDRSNTSGANTSGNGSATQGGQ